MMRMTNVKGPMSKEAPRTKELLVACPLCHQGGFTARGLRSHWCDKNGKKPLAKSLLDYAISEAQKRLKEVPKTQKHIECSDQVCRICGCTEFKACMTPAGPCHWVEPGLCSGCHQPVKTADAKRELDKRMGERAADAHGRRRYFAQQMRKGEGV